MNVELFFGRFHPIVVHFPIGLLVLGFLMQIVARKQSMQFLRKSLPFILLISSISALISVVFGWWIAEQGYPSDTLFWHRWGGVSVLTGSTLLWIGSKKSSEFSAKYFNGLYSIVVMLVLVTGHLGGNLTHGNDYLLEHAPRFVSNWFEEDAMPLEPIHPDSATIYEKLISPILIQKCGSCHDPQQNKGGLDVTSFASLSEGGDGGEVIAQNASSSELFRRVTLPPDHSKFMPPQGEPLSYSEILLLQWWLNSDDLQEGRLSALENSSMLPELILRDMGVDVRRKALYETLELAELDPMLIDEIQKSGFAVRPLYDDSPFLDVSLVQGHSLKDLTTVNKASEHITWLDLGHSELDNERLAVTAALTNLTRLELQKTQVNDDGLKHISQLAYLESLNLYGTEVSDQGLMNLSSLKSLKRLYVWDTKVTRAGAEKLQEHLPNLEVILGY